jgi:DNA-binding beta-propeller fold protein YncE/tRNA A-37 threonylcarbamoyl transferase component Bud32
VPPAANNDDRDAEPTRAAGRAGAGASDLAPGATFAGHRIEAVAGTGGMGVVYRARNVVLDRERAIKVIAGELSQDRGFRERFRRESRLAASIEHPNLVPVYHAGDEQGRLYLTMRFVDGTSLGELIGDEGRLDPERAIGILDQVAAALDAAHAGGLVHRDVKPANVLLEGGRGREHAYLTDFGISKLVTAGTDLTTTGRFIGTVDYVAPEQIAGEAVDGRADIYSLACVAFHALAGEPPFGRDTQLATLFAHANAPRPPISERVPGLPPELDQALARGMAQRREDRFESAGELADGLHAAIGTAPTAAHPRVRARDAAAETQAMPAPSRGRLWFGLAAVAAVAALLVAAVLVIGGGDEDDASQPAAPQPRAEGSIRVGEAPKGITVGAGTVWVAATGDQQVDVINPRDDRPARAPIEIPGNPASVAVGFGSLWVVDHQGGSVLRFPDNGDRDPDTIEVGDKPSDVAVDRDWVWVTNEGADTLSRIDPGTGAVETVHVDDGPRSVATGDGSVWVVSIEGRSVTRIDPDTAKRTASVDLGQRPNDLAVGEGYVWVTDVVAGTLSRIDPQSARRDGNLDVGVSPRGVKTGFGYVWVVNGGDDNVVRVDPGSAELVGNPIPVGDDPGDVAVGEGRVWASNTADATVTPIRP